LGIDSQQESGDVPTVLYEEGFRFCFYAGESGEPAHVHVGKGGQEAKSWFSPISEARNHGFNAGDRKRIERIIKDRQSYLLTQRSDFFSTDAG